MMSVNRDEIEKRIFFTAKSLSGRDVLLSFLYVNVMGYLPDMLHTKATSKCLLIFRAQERTRKPGGGGGVFGKQITTTTCALFLHNFYKHFW